VFFDIAPQGAMSKKIPTGEFSIDFFEELSFDLDTTQWGLYQPIHMGMG
jgi:hypothetical protein